MQPGFLVLKTAAEIRGRISVGWSLERAQMPFDSFRIHEVPDDVLTAVDYCYEQGWTDGLPVVPPVIDRVEATLAYEGRPPEAVIATHPATGLQLSVHAAAVNAVMVGCLPEYFPVLVAAFEAIG
jgi:hypothetical protein